MERTALGAPLPAAQRPGTRAPPPDGRTHHVACARSGAVSVTDTETLQRVADVAVGKLPWGVVVR